MAARVLMRLLRGGLSVAFAAVAIGCPHDWSAFESAGPEVDTGITPSPDAAASASTDDASGPATNDAPETFATLTEKPTLITADVDGVVLATVEGSVLSCAHGALGCASPTVLASTQHDIRSLAMGYGFVAWASRGDKAVRRISRAASQGPIEQATDDDGLLAVALTASQVYFSVDAQGRLIGTPGIRHCAPGVDCQTPVFGGFADGVVTALTIDGTQAFWLGEGSVFGCALADCESDVGRRVVLANEPNLPFALAVDGERVFYGSSLDGGSIRAVSRAALTGAATAPIALATQVGAPTRLATTTHSVWFTSGAAGTLSRVSKVGGAAVVVASGLAAPSGLAVGGGHVYVTCAGDGRVLRWKED